ncbi:MAG: ribosome-associated translation inhibitor RaiA [Planctomycetota bacterium]
MNIEISIPHGSYPASIRSQIEEKLEGLDRFDERTQNLKVILDKDNVEHRVELIATRAGGPVLVVDSKADSLSKALDEAIDRIGRAMRKRREKETDLNRGRHHPA